MYLIFYYKDLSWFHYFSVAFMAFYMYPFCHLHPSNHPFLLQREYPFWNCIEYFSSCFSIIERLSQERIILYHSPQYSEKLAEYPDLVGSCQILVEWMSEDVSFHKAFIMISFFLVENPSLQHSICEELRILVIYSKEPPCFVYYSDLWCH